MVSFFCVLAPEGMNAIVFEERRGRGQKVVAYSDIAFGTAHIVRWMMVLRRPRRSVDKFIIILSQYIIFPLLTRYLSSKQ